MALHILTKGPSLNWTEDNELYDYFKVWREKVEMLTTGMALKKEPQEFICQCIKAWSGETVQAYIECTSLIGDDATSTKHIFDALEGHSKPGSNEIIAAIADKQLVQGDLCLPENIKKSKEIAAVCIFEAAYDKCLQKVILLLLRNQWGICEVH